MYRSSSIILLSVLCLLVAACDDERTGLTPALPSPAPDDLVIYRMGQEAAVHLAWTPHPHAIAQRVYRAHESNGNFVMVAELQDSTWMDTEVPLGGPEHGRAFYTVTNVFPDREWKHSNKVGYVWIDLLSGGLGDPAANPFGLPFKFWVRDFDGVPIHGYESFRPSDIVGDQTNPGDGAASDKIIRQDGNQAFRNSSDGDRWTGLLEENSEMEPGAAYWYMNKSGTPRTLVLAGEVDDSGYYGTVSILAPADEFEFLSTPYSWRESRRISVVHLGLLAQGFTGGNPVTSDKLFAQTTGAAVNYLDSGVGWDGGFTTITPGQAYWIANKHVGHPWTYEYRGVEP